MFEQGSFDVGRFRDWRALSCFGSRVEDDDGDGDGVDGVGERGGERERVGWGVRRKRRRVRERKMVESGVGFIAWMEMEIGRAHV